MYPKFGDIYYAILSGHYPNSVQTGTRPVLIAQNNTGNKYSPTVTVIPVTKKHKASYMPTHIDIDYSGGLAYNSVLMVEQIQTISKDQLVSRVGKLDKSYYEQIKKALSIQCPF